MALIWGVATVGMLYILVNAAVQYVLPAAVQYVLPAAVQYVLPAAAASERPASDAVALEKELAQFKKYLPILLPKHRGEWALVIGSTITTWHCYQDAIKLGYERNGLEPFLVKQITEESTQRFFLGLAGRIQEGVLIPESVSILDRAVDPYCYIDVPLSVFGIEPRVPDHPKTAPVE